MIKKQWLCNEALRNYALAYVNIFNMRLELIS